MFPGNPLTIWGNRLQRFCFGAVVVSVCTAALAGDTWTDPRPGIRYLYRTTDDLAIRVLKIDLTNSNIYIRTALPAEVDPGGYDRQAKALVGTMAERVGAFAAINANYFGAEGLEGLAVVNGAEYHGTDVRSGLGLEFSSHAEINLWGGAQSWMHNAVGGGPIILWDGVYNFNPFNENFTPQNLSQYRDAKDPQTLAGVSQDGKTLILVVLGSKFSGVRYGYDAHQSAELLREMGAYVGIKLDGGGSSEMYLDGQIFNGIPGQRRLVSDALCVFYGGVPHLDDAIQIKPDAPTNSNEMAVATLYFRHLYSG